MGRAAVAVSVNVDQQNLYWFNGQMERIQETLGKSGGEAVKMACYSLLTSMKATTRVARKIKLMKTFREISSRYNERRADSRDASRILERSRRAVGKAQTRLQSVKSDKARQRAQQRLILAEQKFQEAQRRVAKADESFKKAEDNKYHVWTEVYGFHNNHPVTREIHGMDKTAYMQSDRRHFAENVNAGLAKSAWWVLGNKTRSKSAGGRGPATAAALKFAQSNTSAVTQLSGDNPFIEFENGLKYAEDALGTAKGQTLDNLLLRATGVLKKFIDDICMRKFGFVPEDLGVTG